MSDYPEMNETHGVQLRQSLGMMEHEILPPKLVEKYWELKRIFDRTGTIVQTADLAMLCYLHGAGKPTPKEQAPPTVVSLYRAGKFKIESTVIVKWRNAEHKGVLKQVTGNDELVVQIDGDAEERRFSVEDVRLPKKAEKPAKAVAVA